MNVTKYLFQWNAMQSHLDNCIVLYDTCKLYHAYLIFTRHILALNNGNRATSRRQGGGVLHIMCTAQLLLYMYICMVQRRSAASNMYNLGEGYDH